MAKLYPLSAGISAAHESTMSTPRDIDRDELIEEQASEWVLRLSEGSVVELDKLAGDPVDIYVNDRHVARGAPRASGQQAGGTVEEL